MKRTKEVPFTDEDEKIAKGRKLNNEKLCGMSLPILLAKLSCVQNESKQMIFT